MAGIQKQKNLSLNNILLTILSIFSNKKGGFSILKPPFIS